MLFNLFRWILHRRFSLYKQQALRLQPYITLFDHVYNVMRVVDRKRFGGFQLIDVRFHTHNRLAVIIDKDDVSHILFSYRQ